MAVTKQIFATDASSWTVLSVCNNVRDAFIGAGLMTAWHDTFNAGGYEHRVLEIIYDSSKTYGKTYYHFVFNGIGIWLRSSTGWNTTLKIPAGPTNAGVQYVDWGTTATNNTDYAFKLIELNATVSFSFTRYTSTGSRSFFVARTGTTSYTFTIDPAGTTFRSIFDLNLGYHHGCYWPGISNTTVLFVASYRTRRELLLGSALNNAGESSFNRSVNVSSYILQSNYGTSSSSSYTSDAGLVLPAWTTAANPSVTANFNPVYTGLRLTSIHTGDLPSDFGISMIKTSNNVAIQDNATVTAGSEEYEVLLFSNRGFTNSITSNPVFLARLI
jgi:hypothetical protein